MPVMDIRDRILEAAKRVYAQHGFRGATTRLIAIEADVNEVTLFRTFGSKAALFETLMAAHNAKIPIPELPAEPADPEREMTDWVRRVLGHLRENRAMIRTSIGEAEERPGAAVTMCEGPTCAGRILSGYMRRLQDRGMADPTVDVETVRAMLMSAMFGDAICRDMMEDVFPEPESEAAAKYVGIIARALGIDRARPLHVARSVAGD
jgi:AcrR family transcriptional regulator